MVRFGHFHDNNNNDHDIDDNDDYDDDNDDRFPNERQMILHDVSITNHVDTVEEQIDDNSSTTWKTGIRSRFHQNRFSNGVEDQSNFAYDPYQHESYTNQNNVPDQIHPEDVRFSQKAYNNMRNQIFSQLYQHRSNSIDENHPTHLNEYSDHHYDPYRHQQRSKSSTLLRRVLIAILVCFLYRHYHELSLPFQYVSVVTCELCSEIYILAKKDTSQIISQFIHLPLDSIMHYKRSIFSSTPPNDKNKCILNVPSTLSAPLSSQLLPEFSPLLDSTINSNSFQSPSEIFLNNGIVGQSKAIDQIVKVLEGWNLGPHISTINSYKNEIHDQEQQNDTFSNDLTDYKHKPTHPLAILLTGPDGVGKSETTYLLSQLLFSNCNDTENDSVLILHGEDFINVNAASNMQNNEFDKDNLMEHDPFSSLSDNPRERLRNRIIQHIYSHQHDTLGSIIVFNGMEEVNEASTLDVFSEMLNLPMGTTLSERTTPLSTSSANTMESSVKVTLDRTLFIFTTDLGTDKLFQQMKQHEGNGNQISNTKLSNAVRDAIDWHWGGKLKLTKYLDVIVPFMPLRHSDMVEIMRRKVYALSQQYENHSWKYLSVTDSALRFLVGTEFLDYIDLRSEDNNDMNDILLFSRYGAHNLEKGGPMNIVRSKIRRYLHPPRKDEVALFDLDKARKQVTISWCKETDPTITINRFNSRWCDEVWSGAIQ